jgi:hypothetical protein
VTTGESPQPAPPHQASQHLTAVAAGFATVGISTRLTHLGDIPVLTIEEPTGGPNPTTITIDPDTTTPTLTLDCTCLWTPAPGAAPEAIAEAITTILTAIRPLAALHPAGTT